MDNDKDYENFLSIVKNSITSMYANATPEQVQRDTLSMLKDIAEYKQDPEKYRNSRKKKSDDIFHDSMKEISNPEEHKKN